MEIGTVIKEIRKQKGISQKELAKKCGISVNALCQIEGNNTFPQQSTIRNICASLDISPAYLLFFSLGDEEIPSEKRLVFNTLRKAMKEVLIPGE